MKTLSIRLIILAGCLLVLTSTEARAAALTFSAAGPDPASIQTSVNAFRSALGGGSVAGANGSFGGIRREINWDGVPDAFSSPNNLPANFFNVNSPRGAVFATSGTGFQVSANGVNPTSTPIEFGNLNAQYSSDFLAFSPQRLFTALGSSITDVNFFSAGTATPATVRGFGAVFTDVDLANTTSIQYFDQSNTSLGTFFAPTANNGLSFLGVQFDAGEQISRARIKAGNNMLGPNDGSPTPVAGGVVDVVAMDDFLYSEPQAIPEPATLLLLATGFVGLAVWRNQRRNAADSR